jgi:type II secretory pathway pseudopilin PulG
MMKKLPVTEIVVVTLALLAGAGVYVWAHSDQATLEESKEVGAVIVQALQAHRADTGTYPADLEALVPAYLQRVDQPTWGLERWRYRRFTPAEVKAEAVVPADGHGAASTGAAGAVPGAAPGAAATAGGEAPAGAPASSGTSGGDPIFFQLSVAANASGYPVLYYDYTARRWVLNN